MKILMIRRENVCYGSLDCFMDGIRMGMEKQGACIEILDVSDDPTVMPGEAVIKDILESDYDAALTFNAVGQQNYVYKDANLWDMSGIPFINYIVDHPLLHNKNMIEHGGDYHVVCVDKNHCEFIKKYYPGVKSVFFMPLGGSLSGGSENDSSFDSYLDRKTDVLFAGTYIPLSSVEKKIYEYPASVRKLIVNHIDYMLDHRQMTEEEGIRNILCDMGVDIRKIDMSSYLFATRLTEEYVKAYLREETIRYMIDSGINMEIYGNNWNLFDADMKNTICYSGVDYREMSNLYLNSKIVLDQSSHFKYGMHDRIPSSMLAGAAVLTDSNEYLKTIFTIGVDDGEICMYDDAYPSEIPDIVYDMLRDKEKLYAMTIRAKKRAAKNLSWDFRGKEMMNIIGSLKSLSKGVCHENS